jgi:hypothetical protein
VLLVSFGMQGVAALPEAPMILLANEFLGCAAHPPIHSSR